MISAERNTLHQYDSGEPGRNSKAAFITEAAPVHLKDIYKFTVRVSNNLVFIIDESGNLLDVAVSEPDVKPEGWATTFAVTPYNDTQVLSEEALGQDITETIRCGIVNDTAELGKPFEYVLTLTQKYPNQTDAIIPDPRMAGENPYVLTGVLAPTITYPNATELEAQFTKAPGMNGASAVVECKVVDDAGNVSSRAAFINLVPERFLSVTEPSDDAIETTPKSVDLSQDGTVSSTDSFHVAGDKDAILLDPLPSSGWLTIKSKGPDTDLF